MIYIDVRTVYDSNMNLVVRKLGPSVEPRRWWDDGTTVAREQIDYPVYLLNKHELGTSIPTRYHRVGMRQ